MQASAQLGFDLAELGLPPLPHRLPQDCEVTLPRLATRVGEAEEIEGGRLGSAVLSCGAAEADETRLVGMQIQAEPREAFAQRGKEGFGLVAEQREETGNSGSPRSCTTSKNRGAGA